MTKNKKKEPLIVVNGREIRRGRPSLGDSEKKSHIIQLRVSGEERDLINAEAEKAGNSVSEWIRGKLFPSAK